MQAITTASSANLIIIGIVLIVIVGLVLYFMRKRSFSIGKDGITLEASDEQCMRDKIPMIDAEIKQSCREVLTEHKTMIKGTLALKDNMKILAVEAQILDVMKQRIRENDLIEKFIDKSTLSHWIDRCLNEVIAQIHYVEKFAAADILNDDLEASIREIIVVLYKAFFDYCVKGVKEKIKYYSTLKQTDKVRELVQRNQGYMTALKQVRYA